MANVRIYTVSNKPLAAYDSAVEYMQDIQPGSLLQSIYDGVRNPRELYYYLPAALINARPVRHLEFVSGVEPNDPASFGSKNLWENIQSCLVYITGDEVPHPGGRISCIKKFPLIVIPKLIYDYHSDDPDNSRKKFERSKHWACANHHYDCEWSRCEVWVLLSLPDPRLESARARACALPQPALPPHAPQSTAVQAVVPQSVAFPPASFPPAAPQPAASQTLAAQPVTTHPAPAQRGAQFNGRGALRGTGRGPSRGTTSGGVKSRRGTAGPGRSDNQRQAVLSRVSHGSTQTQPGTLSSVGSGGGNCHISGPGVASYQMPPYQTPYNTAPAQLTFNAMQPPFQGIDPPGRFAQAPFDQPQIWGAPRSQNQNLQFSHPDNSNQGFSEINDHQLGLVARWKSQQRRSEQNNTSLLPRQMPADQTLDLLQLGSQPAAFQQTRSVYGQTQQTLSQQDSPRWVDPRQLTRQQMPAHGGLVSDAAFLQQQMNDQQAAGSAAGGSQDPTNSSRQEYGTMGLDNMAAEPPAVSQHPHENSRDAC